MFFALGKKAGESLQAAVERKPVNRSIGKWDSQAVKD